LETAAADGHAGFPPAADAAALEVAAGALAVTVAVAVTVTVAGAAAGWDEGPHPASARPRPPHSTAMSGNGARREPATCHLRMIPKCQPMPL
jgi:hypothetical protein